jgi:hypothetical protein
VVEGGEGRRRRPLLRDDGWMQRLAKWIRQYEGGQWGARNLIRRDAAIPHTSPRATRRCPGREHDAAADHAMGWPLLWASGVLHVQSEPGAARGLRNYTLQRRPTASKSLSFSVDNSTFRILCTMRYCFSYRFASFSFSVKQTSQFSHVAAMYLEMTMDQTE